jgi:glycosyltransferase involved in cell wall biosynthesis
MEKKRILIAMQYMELGGVERSLLGLLEAIDYNRVEVDLFLYRHSGELMAAIPSRVRLLPEIAAYTTLTRPIADIVREGHVAIALARLWAKARARKFARTMKKRGAGGENYSVYQYVADATTRHMPPIEPDTEYDLAISFLAPHNIVRDKVRARRRVAWIHTDYSNIEVDTACEMRAWSAFDTIAAISDEARVRFVERFPELAPRVVVIENTLSVSSVREQAESETEMFETEMFDTEALEDPAPEGTTRLLTVGRFCYPKAFDRAVEICAELVRAGVAVRWYAIGYGDRDTVDDAIRRHGMEHHFIVLGKKANPYPWIAACDIYVQPSRYEGKAVTVREAQALGKPVVITNFATSASQLRDGVDGVIVPMDISGAARGIAALINDPQRREALCRATAATDYSNAAELEKIYSLI